MQGLAVRLSETLTENTFRAFPRGEFNASCKCKLILNKEYATESLVFKTVYVFMQVILTVL